MTVPSLSWIASPLSAFGGSLLLATMAMLCFLTIGSAGALSPEELMATPAQEARAAALEKELRCPVCQNQSIHDSDADLARDLRGVVRQKIKDGESDARIKAWLVERYGDFVLMTPPMRTTTLPLWLGPAAFAVIAAAAGTAFFRRKD